MPVSETLIQERAVMTSEMVGIKGFKASNGWPKLYLRRSAVEPSYKLRFKANASFPICQISRMFEILSAASHYELCNIWNIHESVLLFLIGPTIPTCMLPSLDWKYLDLNSESTRIE